MKTSPVDSLTARQLGLDSLQRTELEKCQIQLVRQTIDHVKKLSPFYRKHLAAIKPGDIQNLNDLARLPFLNAKELTTEGTSFQCLSQSEIARIITLQTSGSTGQPKRLAFSASELNTTRTFFREGMSGLLQPKERVLVLLPYDKPDSVGDLLCRSLPEDGHSCLAHWPPGSRAEMRDATLRSRAACVIGLPQHLLALSTLLVPGQIRTMLLCSDYAPPSLRERIEQNCGCETFLHYGTTESGLGGAVECEAHSGCHLREADLLLEIIDPISGKLADDGVSGEIVLTTLSRRCMPLLRYRTGDIAALLHTPCRCGGITARLVNILGRMKECWLQNNTLLRNTELDQLIFSLPELLDYRAQLVLRHNEEQLDIEYLAHTPIPNATFHNLLGKRVKPGRMIWSEVFSQSHTVKRTLADLR